MRFHEALGIRREAVQRVAVDLLDQRIAGRKMPVERADSDTRRPRDLIQAGRGAGLGEARLGRVQQALTVALRVGARLAGG
jgi:hypothetical protein